MNGTATPFRELTVFDPEARARRSRTVRRLFYLVQRALDALLWRNSVTGPCVMCRSGLVEMHHFSGDRL